MAYSRGDKFSFKTNIDIEILGYFPKGESRDGKAKYSATLNGIKMLIEEDFIENLKANEVKEEVKEGTKFVDADLKVKTEPIIVRVQEEDKPKKEKKNGRKRNA